MSNGVDLAQPLTVAAAGSLVKNAITHVGRYLSTGWKGLTSSEVTAIKAAGLQIFSIYEKASTDASYFTAAQGKADAAEAISLAKGIGQPAGSAIYFTVDYDAQPKDFPSLLNYFQAVKANLQGYKLGAYGSFTVLTYLKSQNIADYYFQTVAWSKGQHCNFLNLFQYQCDKQDWNKTGLNVDLVNLEKADVGSWGQEMVKLATTPATPVKNGWLKENNIWHYYKNNVMVKNDWAKDSKGLWYYLSADGSMAAAQWVKWKDKWYYLKADGAMATGVIEDKGKLYYLQPDGSMLASGRVNVSLNVSSDGSLHP